MGKPIYKSVVRLFRFSTNSVITVLYAEILRVKNYHNLDSSIVNLDRFL